ncbi:MAG: Lysyl-tRNA synthetase [Chthoniobacter sp.]|nr:Lysyl-tRNA synthetase [Chthoniobacter sp.]
MFWTEEIAARCTGPQLINDSKTPSGRVHVGALRGVLIHDAIFRTLREKGVEARYLFGVDDFDPVDEIPKGEDEHFGQYIGRPLCNTPAPGGGTASDMAEHYMAEFWQIFDELGVKAERYRMRDLYRSGKLNEPIDTILRAADKVRRVYKEVSNSDRPAHWHPFQVICEKCGCIGTTEVSDYDGREVTYTCRTDKCVNTKLNLGRGCGYEGKTSPFDGRGKLPWKLEWVAKWLIFPVTIEGAGKDHSTKGGSRDVSDACLRAIYGKESPLRVPYEFFLVGGAKMSSSRGVGASARDIANLLPPEVLRFLMIRTKPNSALNFDTKEEGIIKLFNEFDRYHTRATREKTATPDEASVYRLAELQAEGDYFNASFQLISALVQMPHLDAVTEVEKRKGAPLTGVERKHLDQRIAAARVWVENYASEEEKTRLQETLPARANELSAVQRAFLSKLADALPQTAWEDDALQTKIFEVARLTPIEQAQAFKALYRVLLDRESGPKAGNLLAFLDPPFVIARCRELPVDRLEFWRQSATAPEELEKWFAQNAEKIAGRTWTTEMAGDLAAFEITVEMKDGKRQLKRVLLQGQSPETAMPGLLASLAGTASGATA